MAAAKSILEIDTFNTETGDANVIVETPRGHRAKIKYEPSPGLFRLDKILPVGMVFPQDFGFFPSTIGDDGDPLDALVLMEEPTFPGILVPVRLVGVIEAEQTANGQTIRNDRILTIASKSIDLQHIQTIDDFGDIFLTHLEHFFIAYNEMEGRQFKPIRRAGQMEAKALLDKGCQRFQARPASTPVS